MYVPKVYREKDLEEVRSLIRSYPFATLVGQLEGSLWATHLPLHHRSDAEGNELLTGHVAKRNPHWKELEEEEVLAIFQGPDAYISSSWYGEENVPTWNYQAVHAYGRARILDRKETVEHLRELVDEHEKEVEEPVSVESMSEAFFEKELKGLVAFEIQVDRFHAAAKLSQDKGAEDRESVVDRLQEKEDPKARRIAQEIKRKSGEE